MNCPIYTTKGPRKDIQHLTKVPDLQTTSILIYIPDGPSSSPLVPRVYSGLSRYLGAFILILGLNKSLSLEGVGDLGV
jgi:hypothetical protein